jgi:hypothetical protein
MLEAPSIHYRRRWYYVMWCALLLASLGALGLWEIPIRTGSADLTIRILVANVPPGCTSQVWAGPKKRWPAADQTLPMNQLGRPLTPEGQASGSLKLQVGYRRWIGGILPRRTDDLLVVKFQPRSGAPRYFGIPLEMDWHTGLLRPGQRMVITTTTEWDGLWPDPGSIVKTS